MRAIACLQENPKKPGTACNLRYEAYKSATTVSEFLAKGGTPADLAHDVGKGFVWYLDEGPHVNPVAKRERKPPTEKPKKASKVPLARDDPWSAWNDDDLDDFDERLGLGGTGHIMKNKERLALDMSDLDAIGGGVFSGRGRMSDDMPSSGDGEDWDESGQDWT